jgi:glycosyltransferase involved in cell wall biosynthesis
VLSRGSLPFPRVSAESVRLVRALLRGAEVFHLHVPWDPICVQLAGVARKAGVPYVMSTHGMLDEWTMAQKGAKKRLYLALLGRRMLERASAVHCTAEAEKNQSQKWYPRGRSVVIPLLADLGPFDPLPGPELARQHIPAARTDKPLILFMGRLSPIKRLELLINAAGELKRMQVPFRVLLAGPGDRNYEQELRRLTKQLDLEQDIAFLGFVGGREKISLYEASTAFVLPSHHENFGFVSVESLACRTPVVTTRGVNIWPELQASGGAVIVPAEPREVADAVRAIVTDPARRRAMGDAGRAWVLASFGVDSVASRYESMYRGLAE